MVWSISFPWLQCLLHFILMCLCYKYELKTFILFTIFLIAWKICRTRKFSGFHNVLPKDSILLGYDTVRLGKLFPTFRAHVGVLTSKMKVSKKNSPNFEDATTTLSWNVWNNLPSSTASNSLVDGTCHSFAFSTYGGNSTVSLMAAHCS